jgi:predicted site-specific integrase-resolvase
LRTVRTAGNQRRIPVEEIFRLRRQGAPQAPRCAIYARVSSVRQEQDGNLSRQTERLKEAAHARGYEVVAVITEQASSLNERRRGMKKLLTLAGEQAVDVVLIEYPDRLVRFGFSYLDQAFQWHHVRASSPRSAPNPGADRRADSRHAHHCDRFCGQTLWAACERAAHPRSKRTQGMRTDS